MARTIEEMILDEVATAALLQEKFMGRLVMVYPRALALKLSEAGVRDTCMGRLVDCHSGGIMLEHEHRDGTKTQSFIPRENIGMVSEIYIDPEAVKQAQEEQEKPE